MRASKILGTFLAGVVFLVIFAVTGAAVCLGLTWLGLGIEQTGIFVSWHQMEGNPHFARIEEATSQMVWARSDSGDLYFWNRNCFSDPGCETWVLTDSVPDDLHTSDENPIERNNECEGPPSPPPSGTIIECVKARQAGAEYSSFTYYALLDSGTIWDWNYYAKFHLGLFLQFAGVAFGLLAGVIVFLIVVPKRLSKWVKQSA